MTKEMTRHIADLAYFTLTESEITAMASDLSSMINGLDEIKALDTEVEPRVHVLPRVNHWRKDVVQTPLPREALLANVPAQKDGYIMVPRTLDEGGVTQ